MTQDEFRGPTHNAIIGFGILGAAIVALAVLVAVGFSQLSDQAARIQAERVETIVLTCWQMNTQYDVAIAQMHSHVTRHADLVTVQKQLAAVGIKVALPAVERYVELSVSRQSGIAQLVNALVPKRADCKRYAASITQT